MNLNTHRYIYIRVFLKGLYTLVFEKKADFYDFLLEKQHIFFKLNAYLFIHVEKSFTNFFKKKNS